MCPGKWDLRDSQGCLLNSEQQHESQSVLHCVPNSYWEFSIAVMDALFSCIAFNSEGHGKQIVCQSSFLLWSVHEALKSQVKKKKVVSLFFFFFFLVIASKMPLLPRVQVFPQPSPSL